MTRGTFERGGEAADLQAAYETGGIVPEGAGASVRGR
jgi:hypothetical protein